MAKFQNVVTGIVWEISDPRWIERCRTNLSYKELKNEEEKNDGESQRITSSTEFFNHR